MSEKLIGILAGMGPRSTAPFIDLVNVVLEKAHPQINIIDSSKCLAETVVSKYLELVK